MSGVDDPRPRGEDPGSPPPADRPRVEVIRGGRLSVEQTAALSVAVAAHAAAADRSGSDEADHAWARAARVESVGRPRIDRPSDLDHDRSHR